MSTHRILIVDSEEAVASLLSLHFGRAGFAARHATDAASMHARIAAERFAVVVLDLNLPGVDVAALARQLRAKSSALVTLSSHDAAIDRVLALETGADDCMSRPLDPHELIARVRAVLRRTAGAATGRLEGTTRFDGWELQRVQRRLTSPAGDAVSLSDSEFALLTAFLQAPRRVVSRNHLMTQARGGDRIDPRRSIDLLVSRLRQKLVSTGTESDLIKTVRGAGYLFDVRSMSS